MTRKRPVKPKTAKLSKLPAVLILLGIILTVTAVMLIKQRPPKPVAQAALSAEEQLNQHLEANAPVFLFFHSNNCRSCLDMISVVNQVYPEYAGNVALVDVDVYAPENQNLLRRAKIFTIPTQVFIDKSGQGKVAMGVMTPQDLRSALQSLADEAR